MENNSGNYSCVDCIWQDQCHDDKPCAFFDDGGEILTDEEIEIQIEQGRMEYREEFHEYVSEYN